MQVPWILGHIGNDPCLGLQSPPTALPVRDGRVSSGAANACPDLPQARLSQIGRLDVVISADRCGAGKQQACAWSVIVDAAN